MNDWLRKNALARRKQLGVDSTPKDQLAITAAALKMSASRQRRYRELLREAIARTVSTPDDVDDEIRQLFAALAH